jgi:hypothetical protein
MPKRVLNEEEKKKRRNKKAQERRKRRELERRKKKKPKLPTHLLVSSLAAPKMVMTMSPLK